MLAKIHIGMHINIVSYRYIAIDIDTQFDTDVATLVIVIDVDIFLQIYRPL